MGGGGDPTDDYELRLEYTVVKISYEWLDIQDLWKLIPKQCELKKGYKYLTP